MRPKRRATRPTFVKGVLLGALSLILSASAATAASTTTVSPDIAAHSYNYDPGSTLEQCHAVARLAEVIETPSHRRYGYDDAANVAGTSAPPDGYRLAPQTTPDPGCAERVVIGESTHRTRAAGAAYGARYWAGLEGTNVDRLAVCRANESWLRGQIASGTLVAMARMRQQYAGRSDPGVEGDIIIGTTAISSGRRLYSSDRFLVAVVAKSGGSAEWVP